MSKVGEVVKFRDKGPSVEEARAAMLAAGETPQGLLVSVAKDVAAQQKAAGGNLPVIPVVPVAAPSRVSRKTPTQARLTLLNPDGTEGETTVVTAKSTFELNSLISRNNMLAQKNKKHIRVEFIDPETIVTNEPVREESAIVESVTEPVQTAVDDKPATVEVVENAKFRGEI